MLLTGPSYSEIQKVKVLLKSEFDMKDLGSGRKILGIIITGNIVKSFMKLSQTSYLKKVVSKFSIETSKPVYVPLRAHLKLSSDQCPSADIEKEDMIYVSYSNEVGSVIYTMIYTRPNPSYVVFLAYLWPTQVDHTGRL